MSSVWFLTALAVLQAVAALYIFREGNPALAAVYALYGVSNIMMIWVHRA